MEQIIVNGLYLGAQYALIALGLTLIFSLMNVLILRTVKCMYLVAL